MVISLVFYTFLCFSFAHTFSLLFDETCQHGSESETNLSTQTSSCNIPDVSN